MWLSSQWEIPLLWLCKQFEVVLLFVIFIIAVTYICTAACSCISHSLNVTHVLNGRWKISSERIRMRLRCSSFVLMTIHLQQSPKLCIANLFYKNWWRHQKRNLMTHIAANWERRLVMCTFISEIELSKAFLSKEVRKGTFFVLPVLEMRYKCFV